MFSQSAESVPAIGPCTQWRKIVVPPPVLNLKQIKGHFVDEMSSRLATNQRELNRFIGGGKVNGETLPFWAEHLVSIFP
jgi:hypothetical protein